jgi:primosomal protein N'
MLMPAWVNTCPKCGGLALEHSQAGVVEWMAARVKQIFE